MTYTTLISAADLVVHLSQPDWLVIDSRFSLEDEAYGPWVYEEDHIPGAIYANLLTELSGPIIPGQTGRHPLPDVETLARTFSAWGIDSGVQVVVYDDLSGAFAGRLWWILHWLGHHAVAVLDGGWQDWKRQNLPAQNGIDLPRRAANFIPHPRPELIAGTELVETIHTDPAWRLLDARNAERYHGRNETIDPVAGHIPGAISAPYAENLGPDGLFLPIPALRARFERLVGHTPPENIVSYCGSGVTATHNILAMAHAGLGDIKLYPGSWSEWITRSERPIAAA